MGMGEVLKCWVSFWGPHNKDCNIFGLYWGTQVHGNYHTGGIRMHRDMWGDI